MMLKNGDVFGKYTVERMLGTGGMGAVYLVRHRLLGSLFALKTLDTATARKGGEFITRFIREGKLASCIRHPNLAFVYDAGLDEQTGLYYLVMDYLPGGSLRDRIRDRGRLSAADAVCIAKQVAAALVTAHERGMVHRDIKPENIMFAADGSAKLVDLGIAKGDGGQDTLVTMADAVFGTPAYMAPEQAIDSSSVDGRADIWSLGIVLYEMLSGRRPYDGNGLGAIVAQLLTPKPFPDVRVVVPDVPEVLAELIDDMCQKDVAQRLPSAQEVVERLESMDCGVIAETDESAPAPVSARSMATMATAATMVASVSDAGKSTETVVPKTSTGARVLEPPSVEKPARRSVIWRRVAIAILVLLCALIGTIAIYSPKQEGNNQNKPPAGEEESPMPVVVTNAPQPELPPPVPLPQPNKPSPEVSPVPSAADVYLVGVPGEEGGLMALSGGVGRFLPISGKPDAICGKIVEIMSQKPKVVYISLVGYAASRDMSEARFENILRGMAGSFASAQTQVILVAGATNYGRIVRAIAQERSLDVVE